MREAVPRSPHPPRHRTVGTTVYTRTAYNATVTGTLDGSTLDGSTGVVGTFRGMESWRMP